MDIFIVIFFKDENLLMKGGVLKSLVKVYDFLGLVILYIL